LYQDRKGIPEDLFTQVLSKVTQQKSQRLHRYYSTQQAQVKSNLLRQK